MSTGSEESQRLIEQFNKRLDKLENDLVKMTKALVRGSMRDLTSDLQKLYPKYVDSSEGTGAQAASQQAKRLADVISVTDEFMSLEEIDLWKKELESFLDDADRLGQELAIQLDEKIGTRQIRQGVYEQISAAAASAGKWLDYESDKTRKGVVGLVTEGVAKGWGSKRLATELRRTLPELYGQAEMVARTEMATAYSEAQRRMTKRLGHDHARWVATEDERTCPNCASRSGLIFRLDEVIMPAHPLCRCAMVPVPNNVVENQDTDLLDENAWGEHREQVAAEFLENKARKFPKAKPPWTIDRVMELFDKHRIKPTPFEKRSRPNIKEDGSARPINVIGADADPVVQWR